MKKIIRLTESDLHKLVKESVQKIIKEAGVVGKINNFNPNKSYGQINGMYADNQRIMSIAKRKLLSIISKPFNIKVYSSDGYDSGYFHAKTQDGWQFESDDIPLDVIIDSYSYYRPSTYLDPEEYGDTEGHIDNIDMPKSICFLPPGSKQWQDIQFDDEIKALFIKNAEPDDINDALNGREEYERDIEAGRYDDYINREIDRRRGED